MEIRYRLLEASFRAQTDLKCNDDLMAPLFLA